MRATIKIEMFAMYEKNPPKYMGWNKEQSAVARVDGFNHHTGELRRVYIHGYQDYSKANSKGSRGIYKLYFVDDGLYEVTERTSWKKVRQYYLLVANGQKTEINLEEALAWLEANTNGKSA